MWLWVPLLWMFWSPILACLPLILNSKHLEPLTSSIGAHNSPVFAIKLFVTSISTYCLFGVCLDLTPTSLLIITLIGSTY